MAICAVLEHLDEAALILVAGANLVVTGWHSLMGVAERQLTSLVAIAGISESL